MVEYTSERRCFSTASKGQKFKKFTEEERAEIVNKYISGKGSYGSIALEYKISKKNSRVND